VNRSVDWNWSVLPSGLLFLALLTLDPGVASGETRREERDKEPAGTRREELLEARRDEQGKEQPAALKGEPRHAPYSDTADFDPHWLVPTLHCAGVSLVTRVSASLIWPEAFDVTRAEENWQRFKAAWVGAPAHDGSRGFFAWDQDPWALNLIGHGLFGSEIYLRHRQSHHPPWLALTMTTLWTLLWEYVVEAWHKHPSAVDLLWTPAGGALLGEGRYWLYRRILRMRASGGRRALLYLIDPLGQLERELLGLRF
jgi:hypothetical protein